MSKQRDATVPNAYDVFTYPSLTFEQATPDRLATHAMLHGLSPAPPDRCRVIELGCGDGSQLLPLALAAPEATFVGVDLAEQPILRARAAAAELGATNLTFHQADVMNFPPSATAPFDYIIAHGLYSWVPPAVQDRILEMCGEILAPHGVAYVSYNALPGGRVRQMLREMLLDHTAEIDDPRAKVDAAFQLLRFLAGSKHFSDEFAALLRAEAERTGKKAEAVLYHDDLAPFNEFLTITEFARRASQHGLQYLSEALFFETQAHLYPPEVVAFLAEQAAVGGIIRQEQYLDYLKCRRFRQTLLVRAEHVLERPAKATRVAGLHVSALLVLPDPPPDLSPGVPVQFQGQRNAVLAIDHAPAKRALVAVARAYPRAISFPDLLTAAGVPPTHEDASVLADVLIAGYLGGLLNLHVRPPAVAGEPGERPMVSNLARWQLRKGREELTTQLHRSVKLDDSGARHLVGLLDGTRDKNQLAAEMAAFFQVEPTAAFEATLQAKLAHLARMGLLMDSAKEASSG